MHKDNYRRYRDAESVPTTRFLQHPVKPNLYYPVHRRADIDYPSARLSCFVTFNTQNGSEVTFTDAIGASAWQAMGDALSRTQCRIHAACLMPDHVHLLLSPSGAGETISDIVARVKSWVYHVLKRDHAVMLGWQPSFYDHCLYEGKSTEEEFQAIVFYIHQNPEKAELPIPYPFLR